MVLSELKVIENNIKNDNGDFKIKGVSLISLGDLYNPALTVQRAFDTIPNINTIRLPVYPPAVESHLSKYPFKLDNDFILEKLKPAVDKATELGLYVIIDWHQISQVEFTKQEALDFWEQAIEIFDEYPNVVYEIYNETTDNLFENYKEHLEDFISKIRSLTSKLLIVPTHYYCGKMSDIINDPFNDNNIVYSLHVHPFRIPDPKEDENIIKLTNESYLIFDEVNKAKNSGLPFLITELGMHDLDEDMFSLKVEENILSKDIGVISWVFDTKWWPPMLNYKNKPNRFGEKIINAFSK